MPNDIIRTTVEAYFESPVFKPYQFVRYTGPGVISPFYAMVIHHHLEFSQSENYRSITLLRLDEQPKVVIGWARDCEPVDTIGPFDDLSKFIVAANRRGSKN